MKQDNILFWVDDISIEERSHGAAHGIVVAHPDIAVLAILTKGGNIILHHSHRLGTDREEYTLPCTNIDNIEDVPKEIEGLLSKINVQSTKITLIQTLSAFPDKYTQFYQVYFVYDAQVRGDISGDFVQTPLQHFEGLITQGKLTDAITISALQIVKSRLYELVK